MAEQMFTALGLPDDLVETVLETEPGPSAAALERINERTLAKVMAPGAQRGAG